MPVRTLVSKMVFGTVFLGMFLAGTYLISSGQGGIGLAVQAVGGIGLGCMIPVRI